MPLTVSTGGGVPASCAGTADPEDVDDIEVVKALAPDQELQSDSGRRWIFFSAA